MESLAQLDMPLHGIEVVWFQHNRGADSFHWVVDSSERKKEYMNELQLLDEGCTMSNLNDQTTIELVGGAQM